MEPVTSAADDLALAIYSSIFADAKKELEILFSHLTAHVNTSPTVSSTCGIEQKTCNKQEWVQT